MKIFSYRGEIQLGVEGNEVGKAFPELREVDRSHYIKRFGAKPGGGFLEIVHHLFTRYLAVLASAGFPGNICLSSQGQRSDTTRTGREEGKGRKGWGGGRGWEGCGDIYID